MSATLPRNYLMLFGLMVHVACAQATWTNCTASTGACPERSAIYTEVLTTGDVLAFGRYDRTNSRFTNETWVLRNGLWQQLQPPVAPSPRGFAAMAFDLALNHVVLFGGMDAARTPLNDTWLWDGSSWREVFPPNRPPGRGQPGLAFDPRLGRMLLCDGLGTETWSFDGFDWRLEHSGYPLYGSTVHMLTDWANEEVLRIDGDYVGLRVLTWTGSQWSATAWFPGVPLRLGIAATFDWTRGRVVLFGGENAGGTPLNQTWEGNSRGWQRVATQVSPPALYLGKLAYSASLGATVLVEGEAPGTAFLDTWLLATPHPASTTTIAHGCAPSAPWLHTGGRWDLPWQGERFDLQLDSATGGALAGPAWMWLGTSSTSWGARPLPLDLLPFGVGGCSLSIRPEVLGPIGSTQQRLLWSIVLPADPALRGLEFFTQALAASGPTATFELSNAMGCRIGVW
ncbi:MAG: hypothetical protein IPM29_10570 [Planctomycetes bacterium]|nr:hypothetical protein [Planctomycetota bacterium]